jgi:alpha-amylase/alpha-mannosidase (GH57 family)
LKYITIHGHFYQPPRENAWTGEIEPQPSASPYHDWNDRILHECYLPNAQAEINDETGKVLEIVNNYEYMNFNFGPTLLHWIQQKYPLVYKEIIEADKKNITKHHKHGNAIAMCYNHIIMPLANEHDKITQVKWGVKDFEFHFGRKPESIWLPETACNYKTVDVLINEGIKYIILDVSQAESIRKKGNKKWADVSNGSIDPKMPYRCYSKTNPDKYIDVFFYDGPISRSVAFDDILVSSYNLLNKINLAFSPVLKGDLIVSVATDGETFGHHKKFTEKTLAYFMTKLAPYNKLKVVNFGEYLAKHHPKYEVILKTGDNDEGTSWSCPHGIRRWYDDCGCSSGGGWNQKWRTPLRDSLNRLRDELIEIYEAEGVKYFKDVWNARNEYINIVLSKNDETVREFLYFNASRVLTWEEIDICWKLLEMQKFAMFMFTSCGWFFSEISGIEATQILQYAARAIELAEEISGKSIEENFVSKLELAQSNVPEFKNGKGVWEMLVKKGKPEINPPFIPPLTKGGTEGGLEQV